MVQAKPTKKAVSGFEDPRDADTYITLGYLEEPRNQLITKA